MMIMVGMMVSITIEPSVAIDTHPRRLAISRNTTDRHIE